MKTKVIWTGLLMIGLAASAWAASPGTVAQDPFDLGTSAAISGMGGASAAAPGGLWSLGYNPAGLSEVTEWRIGGSYFNWIESSSVSYGAFGAPPGFAAGILSFDQGSITLSDQFFTTTTEKVNDFGAIAGYGARLPGNLSALRLGLSAQYWQKNLAGIKAGTFAVNLGGLYSLMKDEQLTLGAYVQNLGPSMKFETAEADKQPLTIAGGAMWTSKAKAKDSPAQFSVMADLAKPTDRDVVFAGGAQVVLKKVLALRAGANNYTEKTSPTFGAGIMYKSFTFDYAYGSLSLLDQDTAIHRVSLGFGPLLLIE
jgi:hypothetical protein